MVMRGWSGVLRASRRISFLPVQLDDNILIVGQLLPPSWLFPRGASQEHAVLSTRLSLCVNGGKIGNKDGAVCLSCQGS